MSGSTAEGAASRYCKLRVRAVIDETPDTRSFEFDVPPALAEAFRYRPGQFLTLRLPVQGRHVPRCYSMSSAPQHDEAPRVTVKRVTGGRGSNWLCDRVRVGSEIEVLPPAGIFTPASLAGDFVLLAGGSGITPVFSILRSVLARAEGRILLVYANRDERSVIFRDRLKALAAEYAQRLQVIHWLDSVQGVPTVAQLAELVRAHRQAQAFICGPGLFMDAAVEALGAIGMPSDHIHVERFVSLPDEEDQAESKAAAEAMAPAVDEAEVELSLDGQIHQLRCRGTETLFEAAARGGLQLPHSCLAGLCAACMCQVQEGSVHMRHNESLDAKDLAKGWTLACQSVPTSARVRIKYPE